MVSTFVSSKKRTLIIAIFPGRDQVFFGKDYDRNTSIKVRLLIKEAPLEEVFKELESLFLKNTIPIRLNRNNKREVGKYRTRTRPKALKNQRDAM